MKIAMIGLRGIPAKSGGVEVVVENLAPLLVKEGADVTVYCRNPYCKERPKEFKGVKLRYLPAINTKITEAVSHTFFSTMDAISKDYDIIHYHAMGNAWLSFLPKLFKKKVVITLHGLDWEREKWGTAAKAFIRLNEKIISKVPDKVISVSKKIRAYFREKYNKNIEFIPNGITLLSKKPLSSLKKFNLKKGKYILFLSRIVPEKGLHYLIQAFKQIDTDMKLVIAGDATHTDKYFNEIRQLAKDDKRIIFTGPLYGNEKIEAFSNAYLFVLPSTMEGMPIVLLEAMSFGLCPLVSNIRENLDVIESHGFSFETKNTKDLNEKLIYILKHPKEAKKKGKLCQELVKHNYRWETAAEKTMEVYNSLVNRKIY
jgi:glycosyltransferase involved in cell wall biosynthesis